MRHAFAHLLALTFCALGLVHAAAGAPTKDCHLKRYASLPISITDTGIPSIPVTINGVSATVALDTSGVVNTVFADQLQPLKLTTKPLPDDITGSAPKDRLSVATIDLLQIGNAQFPKTEALVPPTRPDNELLSLPDTIQGVLGMGVLSSVDLELDFSHRQMNIYSTDHCPGDVVYWADRYDVQPLLRDGVGAFYFPVEMDGVMLATTLNMRLSDSAMSSKVASKVYDFGPASPRISTVDGAKGKPLTYFRAGQISTGGLMIKNSRVNLDTANANCRIVVPRNKRLPIRYDGCYNVFPLQLGMNVLSQLHIYIATEENRLYFTAAEATLTPAAPAPATAPGAAPTATP